MPTTQQLRSRLINKLKELFQLNQPDLDFGFYRIMHAKSEQVSRFLEDDLLAIIGAAFGEVDDSRKAQLKAEYEKEVETAKEYGATDPETVPKVAEARERYETAKNTATAEGEIYDHLYRFFERYYDNGDFISRRYYTRETPGKAAPFAVPYNGEEVKLHWANADQYYIKTAEHFQNYTVDLMQAKEIRERRKDEELFEPRMNTDGHGWKVHFRVVDAAEGEHGNVKASEATKRYFIIHREEPVLIDESGELVIQFEYRPDPEKSGQENTWRDKRNAEAVKTIFDVGWLMVDGESESSDPQIKHQTWWFRKVEGWVPADANNPNNGERQKVLIVWRKLTGKIEEDNLMLDEWFQRNRISTRDFEFDVIYVNGSNNLPNLKQEGDDWKVRLIEEDFMRLMWDTEEV